MLIFKSIFGGGNKTYSPSLTALRGGGIGSREWGIGKEISPENGFKHGGGRGS